MYIQLKEDEYWKSPVLYIHSDEDEALNFVNNWREEVIAFSKIGGVQTPLKRLEVSTAFCDLLYKISVYYLETGHEQIKLEGRIQNWLRCHNESELVGEDIHVIYLK